MRWTRRSRPSATRATPKGSRRSPPNAARRSPGSGSSGSVSPPSAAGLARAWHADPGARLGWRGLPGYEALAAGLPHPVYPTSESRPGFSDEDSLRYAPECGPEFALCWVAVPRSRLTVAGERAPLPAGWPALAEVGIPAALAATHELLPVHPVTARGQLARALAEAGLSGPDGGTAGAVVAPRTWLRVTPTLSTRTVAVDQPAGHAPQAAAADEHPGPAQPPVDQPGNAGRRGTRARHPGRRPAPGPAAARPAARRREQLRARRPPVPRLPAAPPSRWP